MQRLSTDFQSAIISQFGSIVALGMTPFASGEDAGAVAGRADAAMDRATHQGRNRGVVDPD